MEKKPALRFTFTIVAIILGETLYKQFDFKTLQFEHTGLAIIYAVVFAFSIYYLIKNRKKARSNN